MDDYISREEAKRVLKYLLNDSTVECACKLIDIVPAADVEPVRHGRWGKKQGGFGEFAACSLCGEKTPTVGITPNYCPQLRRENGFGGITMDMYTNDEAIKILDPDVIMEELTEFETYNRFRRLQNEIKALKDACLIAVGIMKRSRWIPCSERLPEPEAEVLVVCRRGGVSFVCPAMHEDGKMLTGDSIWNWNEIDGYGLYNEDANDWFIPEGWWEYRQFNDDDVYNNLIDCAVTHWQPLPAPPEEGGPHET